MRVAEAVRRTSDTCNPQMSLFTNGIAWAWILANGRLRGVSHCDVLDVNAPAGSCGIEFNFCDSVLPSCTRSPDLNGLLYFNLQSTIELMQMLTIS